MKRLVLILFFLSAGLQAQNMYTNAPERVFPVLEEFISQNHLRGTRTFDCINRIDSIVIKNIPLMVEGPFIIKINGYCYKQGSRIWIEIDSSRLESQQKFEKTLNHELGHAFGLKDYDASDLPYTHPAYKEIMTVPTLPYYIKPEEWEESKQKFYNSLKKLE